MPVLDVMKEDISDIFKTEEEIKLATEFARKMMHGIFGAPPVPPPDPPPFTFEDLMRVRDFAVNRLVNYPARHRLDGMRRDLTAEEQRLMAFFEAAVEVLNHKGVLDRKRFEKALPHTHTVDHEVNDEETVGHNFTQQKK